MFSQLSLYKCKTQDLVLDYRSNSCIVETDTNSVNFLGFLIDRKLNWEDHILRIESKVCKGIFLIRRLRLCVSLKVLRVVYFAQIHSHLSYGTILWGHQSLVSRLLIFQKKCVRLMCGLPPRGHCRPSFIRLGIMTVPAIFIYQTLLYIKENTHLYNELGSSHDHQTRNRNCLGLFRCNYTKTQKTFYYLSIKFYNALPMSLKSLPFLKFKKELQSILTNNCLYKVEEYFSINFSSY